MQQVKIATHQLEIGMYVARLDRPWVETPFMFQGFLLKDPSQIRDLQKYCQFVYIDAERGAVPGPEASRTPDASRFPPAPIPKPAVTYEVESDFEQEMDVAKESHQIATAAVGDFLKDVRARKVPDVAAVQEAVAQMEESILRNPDAFMWLRRLKKKDTYTYSHCIDSSVLAIAFGRQMGLPRAQIRTLGLGSMLADVGKMQLPESLLLNPNKLTPDEFEVAKEHVGSSLELIGGTRGITHQVLAVVAAHHERFDGSGYPKGLAGGDIPMLARMAAIVDTFDALTSDRPYAAAIAPHEAIRQLYEMRNTAFQDELIEQFIQMLGPYPVGTLVELRNGEVAIVIAQNRVRRLRPQVVVLLDGDKKTHPTTPTRDLMTETVDENGGDISITRSLSPGTYGIDPDEFYL